MSKRLNKKFEEMLIFQKHMERFYAKDIKTYFKMLEQYAKEKGFTDWDTMYRELKND